MHESIHLPFRDEVHVPFDAVFEAAGGLCKAHRLFCLHALAEGVDEPRREGVSPADAVDHVHLVLGGAEERFAVEERRRNDVALRVQRAAEGEGDLFAAVLLPDRGGEGFVVPPFKKEKLLRLRDVGDDDIGKRRERR